MIEAGEHPDDTEPHPSTVSAIDGFVEPKLPGKNLIVFDARDAEHVIGFSEVNDPKGVKIMAEGEQSYVDNVEDMA